MAEKKPVKKTDAKSKTAKKKVEDTEKKTKATSKETEEAKESVETMEEVLEETTEEVNTEETESEHDKRDDEIADLQDRLKRNLAEFDNFRKRTEKEKSQMFDMGAANAVEKLLPVVDNFERGLASLDKDTLENDSFAAGMDKIYQQLLKILDDMGVTVIEAVGQEFNPDFHNAVMHEENDQFGENIVSEEFQKGYMYHGNVIRHSMVKVAN